MSNSPAFINNVHPTFPLFLNITFLHMHLFEFTGLDLRATYLLAAVFLRNKIYFSWGGTHYVHILNLYANSVLNYIPLTFIISVRKFRSVNYKE